MMKDYKVDRKVLSSPATKTLFRVNAKAKPLSPEMRGELLSRLMKIQYYAKKVRIDLLTTLAFLRTRVSNSTVEDWNKLNRLLYYINGTLDKKLLYSKSGNFIPEISIDTSHGIHMDRKGQTGMIVTLGNCTVYATSSKQKLVTRSSFECELVGLGTISQWATWYRNFLIVQHIIKEDHTVQIWQDNQSTILAALRGNNYSRRTKHIDIRYFEANDLVDLGKLVITYKPTGEMLADTMTKPLQGALYKKISERILRGHLIEVK